MSRLVDEGVIDSIIASCNGDMRGAIAALLMVNELLEREIVQLTDAQFDHDIKARDGQLH